MITNTDYFLPWTSKGLYAESIEPSTTSDNSLTPTLNYDLKVRAKFIGSFLEQPKFPYTHKTLVNI